MILHVARHLRTVGMVLVHQIHPDRSRLRFFAFWDPWASASVQQTPWGPWEPKGPQGGGWGGAVVAPGLQVGPPSHELAE